jgi:hypothetical protein
MLCIKTLNTDVLYRIRKEEDKLYQSISFEKIWDGTIYDIIKIEYMRNLSLKNVQLMDELIKKMGNRAKL